jgi:hypothetical protein
MTPCSFINTVNFHLVLTNHIVLQSDSPQAELLMELLEADGVLPKTVTWTGADGFSNRLYQVDDVDEVIGCYEINLGKVNLLLTYGFNRCVYMPPFKPRESKFRWVPGRSLKDMEPAQLPASTLSFLRCLAYFTYLDNKKDSAAKPLISSSRQA